MPEDIAPVTALLVESVDARPDMVLKRRLHNRKDLIMLLSGNSRGPCVTIFLPGRSC